MNYYISDLHFGHNNVIKFDGRPFESLDEMHEALIRNWNSRVTGNDTVYILGDFCWGKEPMWDKVVHTLNGNKVLIQGNHDIREMSSSLRKCFADVKPYKEITDNQKHIIMCHYPILFYKGDYNPDCYMLYGHVHTTIEFQQMEWCKELCRRTDTRDESKNRLNCINVGCMMPWMDYTPRTLDEIVEGYNKFRAYIMSNVKEMSDENTHKEETV